MRNVYKIFLTLALLLAVNSLFAQHIADIRGKIIGTNAGRTDTLEFGFHTNATFCLDADLGEVEAPPPAFPGNYSFRFVNPRTSTEPVECYGNGMGDVLGSVGLDLHTFISQTTKDTFEVQLKRATEDPVFFIQWNVSSLKWVILKLKTRTLDADNCPAATYNMLTQDTLTLDCSDIYGFRIIAEQYIDAVNLESSTIPEGFALAQNFPNPFNPTTSIKFNIKNTAQTTIAVYDMLGRKVSTLVSEQLAPGFYNTTWNGMTENGATAATGTYYIRMNARYQNLDGSDEEFATVQKILLMK